MTLIEKYRDQLYKSDNIYNILREIDKEISENYDEKNEDYIDEIIELVEFLLNTKNYEHIEKIINNENFCLNMFNIYEEKSFERWLTQNSCLKLPSLEKKTLELTDKIMNLPGAIIIHSMSYNEYKAETIIDVGIERNDKIKNYLNDYLYAAIKDYETGIIFIHEQRGTTKILYGFYINPKDIQPIDIDTLAYSDGNKEDVMYDIL